jgi:hypothetical protein
MSALADPDAHIDTSDSRVPYLSCAYDLLSRDYNGKCWDHHRNSPNTDIHRMDHGELIQALSALNQIQVSHNVCISDHREIPL